MVVVVGRLIWYWWWCWSIGCGGGDDSHCKGCSRNSCRSAIVGSMRPCKRQFIFYCHRVVKIIAPIFVYVGPPPLGSK